MIQDPRSRRVVRSFASVSLLVPALVIISVLSDQKTPSNPNGMSSGAQLLWVLIAGGAIGGLLWLMWAAGRTKLTIAYDSIEIRNKARTVRVPSSEALAFVRRGARSAALVRDHGSRISVAAVSRKGDLDDLLTQLNDGLGRVQLGGGPRRYVFRDGQRLEFMRQCMEVALVALAFCVLVAIVGQSNAHNPDGLSTSMRVALIGLCVACAGPVALTFYGAGRACVLIGSDSVEVCNGRRTTFIPTASVSAFVRGRSVGRGRITGVALRQLDGSQVPLAAIGRFRDDRLAEILRELNGALHAVREAVDS